MIEFLCRFWV